MHQCKDSNYLVKSLKIKAQASWSLAGTRLGCVWSPVQIRPPRPTLLDSYESLRYFRVSNARDLIGIAWLEILSL